MASAKQVPQLSKDQRTLLQAVVAAVDAAATQPATRDLTWPEHVMRASDGSHYVAFSIEPPASMPLPQGPVLLYVRLATAGAAAPLVERSAIRDWLAGRRIDPRLLPGRGIAVGEMPAFGASAIMNRTAAPTGSSDLRLMAMERERVRQEQEEKDKQRRAELEGKTALVRELLPFEDFDVSASSAAADGTRVISRAVTAGPGDYDLLVGWADPAAARPAATIRVLKRSLSLPPAAAAGLTLSSIIVADNVAARPVPYPPAEQAAHPYAIGPTDITPARDAVFTRDERIAVAFQVINARASESGKPNLAVNFRIVRVDADRETPVASLNPQYYTDATMPADFDLRMGHPIFVAVAAPLATLPRGDYRLKITVDDRTVGSAKTADADFRVIGTPLSLLAEAPALGRAFRRESALEPARLQPVLDALTPASPSAALKRALDTAAAGKFVDLLVEEPVAAGEQGVRAALTGLALYSVGDASSAVTFQRALQLNAPAAPTQALIGAARAMQGRDPDAIAAWQAAIDGGLRSSIVTPFLIDAYLRRGETARAAALVTAELAGRTPEGIWIRALAATNIATGKEREAIAVLDARLAQQPNDAEAQWLLLHALYASVVRGGDKGHAPRFIKAAQDYKGPHEALVSEWLKVISSV
jgi:hypothetical protein